MDGLESSEFYSECRKKRSSNPQKKNMHVFVCVWSGYVCISVLTKIRTLYKSWITHDRFLFFCSLITMVSLVKSKNWHDRNAKKKGTECEFLCVANVQMFLLFFLAAAFVCVCVCISLKFIIELIIWMERWVKAMTLKQSVKSMRCVTPVSSEFNKIRMDQNANRFHCVWLFTITWNTRRKKKQWFDGRGSLAFAFVWL